MMKKFNTTLKRIPIVGDILVFLHRNRHRIAGPYIFFHRAKFAIGYFIDPLRELVVWLFRSKETANFTYDLTPLNISYLTSLVADITGKPHNEIVRYIAELENDAELQQHIRNTTLISDQKALADLDAKYGRRLGWYAFCRAIKPKIVVETGVDKGLGSCVLTSALMRNAEDGYPGYYYGTDLNPRAGYLLSGKYAKYGKILYGDSIASLERLDEMIDLFVNDSDHSSAYEEREYKTIADKLSPQAVVLGDNSHSTNKLFNFALATNRQFVFFHERPLAHWYPGAGIGIAFTRQPYLSKDQ